MTESGERQCVPRKHTEEVCVGDWVDLDGEWIEAVLPRRSLIGRRAVNGAGQQILAANVDVIFLVTGLDHDFNLRRLERYLVVAAESGCRAVVVLNKADLCFDIDGMLAAARGVAGPTPVVALSALSEDACAVVSPFAGTGETATLLGSSGAGKSTLVNRFRGYESQVTAPVRSHDSRGRHATTRRELILLEQGWLLLDQPGLREVGLWAGEDALDTAFDDIAELARECRFRDCRHQGEPGCAVAGAVDQARLASYHKLDRELHRDPASDKRKWKAIHRAMKRFYRER
jgi:ribosome biogenesis GTPase